MRLASWTVCIRETGRAAPRSARGGGAGAFGFSMGCACGCGRPARGAAGLAVGGATLLAGPALVDKAEAGLEDAAEADFGTGAEGLANG